MGAFKQKPLGRAVGGVLHTRDRSGAHELDELAVKFRDRLEQLDKLLDRNKDKLEKLPDDVKTEMEARSKEIKQISGDIEDIKQKLVEGVNERKADPHSTAQVLIRNKDAVDFAETMLKSRNQKGSVTFAGLNARNIIQLNALGPNYEFAQNDVALTAAAQPLNVLKLINFGSTTIDLVPFLRESAYTIMADIAPEGTVKPESELLFGTMQMNVGTIAHTIKVSNQVLSDMPALANYVETRMAYGIRYKLEYFIINGNTPAAGDTKKFSGLLESTNFVSFTPTAGDTAIEY
jgi:HK97 family phage major capsid protein